ncbi:hypothetical protein RDWZM_000621 [Blomia tropicalis]|uniref:Rho guanine nucleotide exchange factor 4 n=1 Tax=Blomia tropicalis TaxID=40697 RepID=A0A9Q0MA32_BLOTA|nr:hypothetical protein RDWZM_000621 [Blomia tropicalis]
MSQTIESPLNFISDSINGREKLFKLAEGNSKTKKKGSKLFHSPSKNVEKQSNNDLAFTTNIEHLANRDCNTTLRSSTPIQHFSENDQHNTSLNHDVNWNGSCDSNCECYAHSVSLYDSSSPSDLKIADLKICETNSFISSNEFKSRIPQSANRKRMGKEANHRHNNNIRGLNRWPDTEDLSKQNKCNHGSLPHETDCLNSCPMSIQPSSRSSVSNNNNKNRRRSSSNTTRIINHSNHIGLYNQSHIPIYNGNSRKMPSFDPNTRPGPLANFNIPNTNQSYNNSTNEEKRFIRANSFINYLSDNNRKYSHQLGIQAMKCHPNMEQNFALQEMLSSRSLSQSRTSQALYSQWHSTTIPDNEQNETDPQLQQKMAKSLSHNVLHRRCSKESQQSQMYRPHQTRHLQQQQQQETHFQANSSNINAESISAIVNKGNDVPNGDETQYSTTSQANVKRAINRLDSLFVMDEDFLTESPKIIERQLIDDHAGNRRAILIPNSTLLISTPDQPINERHFLIESQKNVLSTINSQSEQVDSKKFAKSNSCDSLDYFRMQTLSKPKSETDLSDTNKNDLTGILHLEQNVPSEENSMFNRFRKTFSLRFSKHWTTNNKDVSKCGVEKELNLVGCESEHKNDNYIFKNDICEQSNLNTSFDLSDINQNRIYKNRYESENNSFSKLSTIDRRKARADIANRKSFRRTTSIRKTNRLKRSHSQPTDKPSEQISPQTDRSVDSDFESKLYNDTKSSSEFNNSPENNGEVIYAEAIWNYTCGDNEELTFQAGDLIDVTDMSNKEWWWGAIKTKDETRYGWFPASYVRLKVSQEETLEEALNNTNGDCESTPKKRMSMSKLSSEQVRANVVLEIINTERDFVKNLKDVIDGYLKPCRDRMDMFDETRISTIFGNIEELYQFQIKFLQQLENSVNWEHMSSSQIGNCFRDNEKGFIVYCEFCKNHPLAISELQDLYTDHKYIVFFEGCRLLQNMIDISLDGFLLTPIQKICKYPLQLGELLKYTRTDHPDYEPMVEAYGCMQRVAQMVNERKRRFESLEQLITLQESFENWEGAPLLDTCSLLIHSGDVTRVTSSTWSKDITLLLFDRLLVLCKRDTGILKKSTYIFKSRIDLDHIDSVVSLEDNNKDVHFGIITKNAFKLHYKLKQKWYLFQTKTAKEKEKWIRSFDEQRARVREDDEQGFFVSEQDKKGARIAHQNHLRPKKPRVRKPYVKGKKPDTVIAEIPLGPVNGFEIDRNRAGSLPSYIYQEKQSLNGLYKHRQSTMHKKSRSNWFHLGSNKNKSRLKRNLK